jgi:hypothetical protein
MGMATHVELSQIGRGDGLRVSVVVGMTFAQWGWARQATARGHLAWLSLSLASPDYTYRRKTSSVSMMIDYE